MCDFCSVCRLRHSFFRFHAASLRCCSRRFDRVLPPQNVRSIIARNRELCKARLSLDRQPGNRTKQIGRSAHPTDVPVDRIRASGKIPAVFVERKLCRRSINWFGKTVSSNLARANPPFWTSVRKNGGCASWCVQCPLKSRIPHSEKSREFVFPMGRKLPFTSQGKDIPYRNTPSSWFAAVGFETCPVCVIKSFEEHSTPPVSMVANKHGADTEPRKSKKLPPRKNSKAK